jgi:hypothetical protein
MVVTKDLSKHLPKDQPAPNLYIFVGPKPPIIDVEAELAGDEAELARAGIIPITKDSNN